MSQQNSTRSMSFYDHFEELRIRFMRSLVVFFLGFVLFYFFADHLLAFLRKPLFDVMPPDQRRLYFTNLFENFLTHLKVAGYASIFFLSPYYLYEVWSFIAPGLYPRERRLFIPFLLSGTFFFIGGACFAYGVLFPVGFKYFVTYGGPTDVPLLTIDAYYGTCLKLLLLFGAAFELPVLICLLGYLGVIDADALRRQRRNAILGITVVSAFAAPPDAVSMLILGVPLVFLYEGSIWVVQLMGSKRKAASQEEPPINPFIGKSQ